MSYVAVDAPSASTALTLTVSDLSHLEVEVALDERDVADVAVGQAARVTVDATKDDHALQGRR